MKPLEIRLPARLNYLRRKAGWTVTTTAQKMHVSVPVYSSWEKGTREPTLQQLSNLSDLFCVSTDYIIGRTNYRNPWCIADDSRVDFVRVEANNAAVRECHKITQLLVNKLGTGINQVMSRVEDEDADLLGSVGVELRGEVSQMLNSVMEDITKAAQGSFLEE